MADLATVRTEIKTWERVFKDSQGRPPTLDDIKANNAIGAQPYICRDVLALMFYPADKYKLYKRLSKAAALSTVSQPSKPVASPSTPPRATHAKAPAFYPAFQVASYRAQRAACHVQSVLPSKEGKGERQRFGL